jgi:hypothetical protein
MMQWVPARAIYSNTDTASTGDDVYNMPTINKDTGRDGNRGRVWKDYAQNALIFQAGEVADETPRNPEGIYLANVKNDTYLDRTGDGVVDTFRFTNTRENSDTTYEFNLKTGNLGIVD